MKFFVFVLLILSCLAALVPALPIPVVNEDYDASNAIAIDTVSKKGKEKRIMLKTNRYPSLAKYFEDHEW